MGLAPGPRSRVVQTIKLLSDPYDHVSRLFAKYGDPLSIPSLFGSMLVTAQPDGARELFSADPDTFAVPMKELSVPILGTNSLLTTEGAAHKRARKLLAPPFHGARMRAYGALVQEVARTHLGAAAAAEIVDARVIGRAISMDVIVRAVFGVDGSERVAKTAAALLEMTNRVRPMFVYFKALQHDFLGLSAWSRFRRARDVVDALIFEEIAARRARPEPGEDVLSLLVAARFDDGSAMDDQAIRDHLLTMLGAGYETSGTMFAWACDLLARHPDALARLREEVRASGGAPDAVAALPWLGAVVNETLRLYPPVATVLRQVARRFTLRGVEVPAGHFVGVAIIEAHRRKETWGDDALSFRPERFLEKSYSPFEFMPYGGGHRRCIGAALAHYELELALAELAYSYDLALADESVRRPTLNGPVIGPKGGVPIRLLPPAVLTRPGVEAGELHREGGAAL
jgi:cytochrome P450